MKNKKTFWSQTISIGTLVVPRFMSAPMDGVTDSPFRQIVRAFSHDELLWGEMRHVERIVHDKTGKDLRYNPTEQPLGFQFSANQTDQVKQAVDLVISHGFKTINLNCGCPSRLITKSGSGSALMANVPLLTDILKAFMEAIDGRVPMTIKIRAGYKEKNALEISKIAHDLGIACIIIHPRTQGGKFSAPLDFDIVKKIKESVEVPVIFSGNIDSFQAAQKTHELTGCDGFMIGRALWGAPWKMHEIMCSARDQKFCITKQEIIHYVLQHLELSLQHYGEKTGIKMIKKHIASYITNIEHAALWREKLLRSLTKEETITLLNQIFEEQANDTSTHK
ncbi:MAG: tRNA-dihydrouridine synthase [bacterium]